MIPVVEVTLASHPGQLATRGAGTSHPIGVVALHALTNVAIPVPQDVRTELTKVFFTFPGRSAKADPVRLEQDSQEAATTTNDLVLGDEVQVQRVGRMDDIFSGDASGRALHAERMQHILGEGSRQMVGKVVDVIRAVARLATVDGNTGAGVRARQIRRELQVQEMRTQRTPIRRVFSFGRPNRKDFERACPRQRKLSLEDLVVGVLSSSLPNGRRRVVNPRPFVHRESWRLDGLGQIGVPALDAGNSQGMQAGSTRPDHDQGLDVRQPEEGRR